MKVKVLSLTRVVSASLLILLLWGKSVDGLKIKRLSPGVSLSSKSGSKDKLVGSTLMTQAPPVEDSCSKTTCPGGIPSKTPGAKSSLHSSDSKPIKSDEKKEEEIDVKSSKPGNYGFS